MSGVQTRELEVWRSLDVVIHAHRSSYHLYNDLHYVGQQLDSSDINRYIRKRGEELSL